MNYDEAPLNQTDEMINNFIEDCEREAAKSVSYTHLTLPTTPYV